MNQLFRQLGLRMLFVCLLLATTASHARLISLAAAAQQRTDLLDDRQEWDAPFASSLEELAAWCDEQKLTDQAAVTRAWQVKPAVNHTNLILLARMPSVAPPLPVAEEGKPLPPAEEWLRRFHTLRNERAEALFARARAAIDARQVATAYGLVLETLHENPDHAAARRVLGYQLLQDRWLSPFELSKVRAKHVWHAQFGWLLADRVARYEAGERYHNGRWISAEDDARAHDSIERGWVVNTEHFAVRTNHSLEEGVRLADQLEKLYEVWRQMFWRFYASEDQLIRFFADAPPSRFNARRHKVVYFRNRQQYVENLRTKQPNIEISTGFYQGAEEVAYFFAPTTDEERERGDTNLYHEATHQLFSESRVAVPNVGKKANFWIIEGIACYLESLQLGEGIARVGGLDAIRVQAARQRLLDDDEYVPLAEFNALGMLPLQRDPRIAMLYSQAAGLTQFLLHAEQGRYRDALAGYLLAVYTGRDSAGTLAELCGLSDAELDQQYRDYMKQQP